MGMQGYLMLGKHDMYDNRLEPCPFCGQEAKIKVSARYPRSGKYKGMSITSITPVCTNFDCIIHEADKNYWRIDDIEKAILVWNKRTNE